MSLDEIYFLSYSRLQTNLFILPENAVTVEFPVPPCAFYKLLPSLYLTSLFPAVVFESGVQNINRDMSFCFLVLYTPVFFTCLV